MCRLCVHCWPLFTQHAHANAALASLVGRLQALPLPAGQLCCISCRPADVLLVFLDSTEKNDVTRWYPAPWFEVFVTVISITHLLWHGGAKMWGGCKIRHAMLRHVIAGCCWQPRFSGAPSFRSAAGAFPCCWRMPRQHGGQAHAARMRARQRHYAETVFAQLAAQCRCQSAAIRLCGQTACQLQAATHPDAAPSDRCQQVDRVAAVRWSANVHWQS
jgi:hypothetical protein